MHGLDIHPFVLPVLNTFILSITLFVLRVCVWFGAKQPTSAHLNVVYLRRIQLVSVFIYFVVVALLPSVLCNVGRVFCSSEFPFGRFIQSKQGKLIFRFSYSSRSFLAFPHRLLHQTDSGKLRQKIAFSTFFFPVRCILPDSYPFSCPAFVLNVRLFADCRITCERVALPMYLHLL